MRLRQTSSRELSTHLRLVDSSRRPSQTSALGAELYNQECLASRLRQGLDRAKGRVVFLQGGVHKANVLLRLVGRLSRMNPSAPSLDPRLQSETRAVSWGVCTTSSTPHRSLCEPGRAALPDRLIDIQSCGVMSPEEVARIPHTELVNCNPVRARIDSDYFQC